MIDIKPRIGSVGGCLTFNLRLYYDEKRPLSLSLSRFAPRPFSLPNALAVGQLRHILFLCHIVT
jgi:hypothetical protein